MAKTEHGSTRLESESKYEEDTLVINYIDHCGGIPEKVLKRMFTAYNSSKNENGSGIGMYIAKQMIDKAGDSIKAEKNENGACFTITLKQ
jgi:K+-sensing histidine kinase KdpD